MGRKRQEARTTKSSDTCDQNGCNNPTSGNNRQCDQCVATIAAGGAAAAAAIVVVNN